VPLTNAEIARYSRHLLLPELGREGQERFQAGSVLCVGTGGLGSPLLLYLAAAGVGRIGIVDFDRSCTAPAPSGDPRSSPRRRG
jgi:molybdopterin/thiamine biosynthesis adenylyltransferase